MEIEPYQLKAIIDNKISDFWRAKVREVFDRNTAQLVQDLKAASPVGATGSLRDGWTSTSARKLGAVGQYSTTVRNMAPNSFYRIVGRGPGKMPPKEPILAWVRAGGVQGKEAEKRTFLIRRKIGQKGTDRWIEGKNPIGITKSGQLTSDSPITIVQQRIRAEIRALKL